MVIDRPNQVWCADITYIPVQLSFLYLVAIMDWATRHVLAWRLSNTMDVRFCLEALNEALARYGKPEVFNTDQGSQFDSFDFTGLLKAAEVTISMDGRCRCMSNILIERLWRRPKYEAVYLHELTDGFKADRGHRRVDQFLQYREATFGPRRPNAGRGLRKRAAHGYMDKAIALTTSPQAQQQQQDVIIGFLAA